ncbi:MAG: hypothetical protein AAGL49_03965, partial [Pseudomonadota bacterium]
PHSCSEALRCDLVTELGERRAALVEQPHPGPQPLDSRPAQIRCRTGEEFGRVGLAKTAEVVAKYIGSAKEL